MSAVAALVAVWSALAVIGPTDVETPEQREHRLQTVAAAVVAEAADAFEVALVSATIEHESQHFRHAVHTGEMRGDGGKAYCLGQLHAQRWLPRVELVRTVGTDLDATRRCIRGVLAAYRAVPCTLHGKLNAYATGRGCRSAWVGTPGRAARVWYYVGVLRSSRAEAAKQLKV